jgi:hypothetical protein
MTHDEQAHAISGQDVLLWLGMMTGPIAYAITLLVSYAIVSVTASDERGQRTMVLIVSALALLATAIAGVLAARLRPDTDRKRFMARGGVAMSIFFGAVIVAHTIPALILRMGQ